jgi:hypothetical protein
MGQYDNETEAEWKIREQEIRAYQRRVMDAYQRGLDRAAALAPTPPPRPGAREAVKGALAKLRAMRAKGA